jgi:excinuclease ABC subunit A
VDTVMRLPEGTRLQVLAPIVRGRKGEYRHVFSEVQKLGFVRVRVDGETYEVTEVPALDRYKQHTIEIVVDRLVVREGMQSRLAEAVETSLRLAKGLVTIHIVSLPEQAVVHGSAG